MDVGMWGTPLFSLAYPELMLPLYPLLFIFSPPYIPCTMYKTVRGLEVYSQLVDWVAWGKHDSHDEHKNPLQSSLPPSLPPSLSWCAGASGGVYRSLGDYPADISGSRPPLHGLPPPDRPKLSLRRGGGGSSSCCSDLQQSTQHHRSVNYERERDHCMYV